MASNTTHSVQLDREQCVGCTNCIKRCPTKAIRVRNNKAQILHERCIDCGECVRICEHHAKIPVYDPISRMDEFEYKIALPAPSMYGQFHHLEDVNIILTALHMMGFDKVFEVGLAAEAVSAMSREYVAAHPEQWPIISTACPAIVKLIYTNYPSLIDHMLPIQPPVELAATLARRLAMEETGLPSEKIGVFFISPCPAKVTMCRQPVGVKKTDIDVTIAIKDVYVRLLPLMKEAVNKPMDLAEAGRIGIGWGVTGGEAAGLLSESYLAADGIENCISVLNDLEDQKFQGLQFVELDSCPGGCVGGVLTVENPYIAKTRMQAIKKYLPVSNPPSVPEGIGMWTEEVEYQPGMLLGNNYRENIKKMSDAQNIAEHFPGIDCGSCGAPTCRALAEDIVRGEAKETDCIYILMDYIRSVAEGVIGDLHMHFEHDEKE
ncbi:MAG: 4Fe-4S binding protein [Lachnospiraceae bacterium]|nr:4Fe-4S binding protein [Lachnospiraceae bacterium]